MIVASILTTLNMNIPTNRPPLVLHVVPYNQWQGMFATQSHVRRCRCNYGAISKAFVTRAAVATYPAEQRGQSCLYIRRGEFHFDYPREAR